MDSINMNVLEYKDGAIKLTGFNECNCSQLLVKKSVSTKNRFFLIPIIDEKQIKSIDRDLDIIIDLPCNDFTEHFLALKCQELEMPPTVYYLFYDGRYYPTS